MSLEQRIKDRKKFILNRPISEDVSKDIAQGKKFIIVDKDLDYIPLGYMLVDMKYKEDSFKVLIPQSLLYFLANPGEGDVDNALDEIADFYENVQDYEDALLEENESSVQGTNWAVTARSAYSTYLINKLTKHNGYDMDKPEWDSETLKLLDLDNEYVAKRVRAIAAVSLGKTAEQVKEFNIEDILKHVTINERKVEQLTNEEFSKVTCWAGSHYEIKEEYRNSDVFEYEIEHRHDRGYKEGRKIIKKQDINILDVKTNDLEKEIELYRSKNSKIGRHDKMLMRMYANLKYISKERPQSQLEIRPPEGEEN